MKKFNWLLLLPLALLACSKEPMLGSRQVDGVPEVKEGTHADPDGRPLAGFGFDPNGKPGGRESGPVADPNGKPNGKDAGSSGDPNGKPGGKESGAAGDPNGKPGGQP